ncbi:MAG: 2-hydroxyglutaryl-CoA dehydratase [Proteobacteria bacterium]|nr:2-hydroxyglutaryl-CoA dehydratase [Pseudomonadota bacterium]
MIVAGCDVGSLTAKAVILNDNEIIATAVIRAGTKPEESADKVLDKALERAGLARTDIRFAVGTGYGKERISFVNKSESEISCHAKGAWWCMPSVRMVIDIGGQDAKAIKIDEKGNISRYIYNDKCASGTGRFLEIMADAMGVNLEDMGDLAELSTEQISISNQCVIFAETEVVSLINDRKKPQDIINGLHHAIANRVASLAKSIGVEQDIVMTGGVAKNRGVFQALSKGLGLPVKALEKIDPQLNGALGAALLALEHV